MASVYISLIRYLTEFGRNLMAHLEYGLTANIYERSSCLEEFIYMYLWLPFIQRELDKYVLRCDNQKRQKSKLNPLPRCAPIFAYENPQEFGVAECGYTDPTLNELVSKRLAVLQGKENLVAFLPDDFIEGADYIFNEILDTPAITLETIWVIFVKMKALFGVMRQVS